MKTILTILISLVVVQNRTTTYSDCDILIEIQQLNIMTGQSVTYSIDDETVKAIEEFENKTRTVARKRLGEEKMSLIAQKTYHLFDSLDLDNTIVSNPEILDGYVWSISIVADQTQRKLTVYNCNHSQLDFLINMINEVFKKKKRLIFPTSRLYSDSKCQ